MSMSETYETILGEIWKSVKNWPAYEVSNLGNVKRVKFGGNRSKIGQNLKPITKLNGYQVVTLFNSKRKSGGDRRKWVSKKSQLAIHRLVMCAFCGECPPGLHVNHRNGDKTYNRLSNLEYVTPTGNMLHAYREGLRSAKGSSNGRSKLNEESVREIRRLAENEVNWHVIAKQFEVSYYAVKHVVNRTRWDHVK